jgi:magnesium transporter
MIQVSLLKGGALSLGGAELLDRWDAAAGDKLWVDIEAPVQAEIEPLLEQRFGFHELAAEDCLSTNTLPKFDPYGDYDFFIFRAVNINVLEHGVSTVKLATFLGKSYVFTIHNEPLPAAELVRQRLPQDRRLMERGADFLLYAILDNLVDLHFPLLTEIEEMVDEIQDLIFSKPSQELLHELLHLKRDLNALRRYSIPQRELFNQISRGDAKFIAPEHLIYFRDLYDHMFRISESIDVERDLLASTMDAYLSVLANRTNDIMKTLTVFSSIMLGMNMVAAIYGMNFQHMPELGWRWGYAFAFGLMAAVAGAMLLWFVHKGWVWSRKDLDRIRRTGYKRITWPVRYARVMAKKVVTGA